MPQARTRGVAMSCQRQSRLFSVQMANRRGRNRRHNRSHSCNRNLRQRPLLLRNASRGAIDQARCLSSSLPMSAWEISSVLDILGCVQAPYTINCDRGVHRHGFMRKSINKRSRCCIAVCGLQISQPLLFSKIRCILQATFYDCGQNNC